MHVELHSSYADSAPAKRAVELTKACVHCGFCLETCPTYRDGRDERDSPRGRIYLVKQLLETGEVSGRTQQHLDRCLTCRGCETTCPSGMQYGELVDIGREMVSAKVTRPWHNRFIRWAIRQSFSRPALLSLGFAIARPFAFLLPGSLRSKIPARQTTGATPTGEHARKMLLLEGCVQKAATPATNAAARRVFDRLGITLVSAPEAGCCGALDYHLDAHDDGLNHMRQNIDAWWPLVEAGAEAIVSSASGCGATVAEYDRHLAGDPAYANKAARISELHRDLSDILLAEDIASLDITHDTGPVAVHTPCTLQHGQKKPDQLTQLLKQAGFELAPTRNSHLCCGSAGSHSILHADMSNRLREEKLQGLTHANPALIATANIGCQLHLLGDGHAPVVHWIELLDKTSG
jgi:glycolate dehydrogenase iron-sulfur subunit